MDRRIVIIDGNSLINRAYYAMQRPMITKEGLYTQGVYGFLNMLSKIKKDYEPSHIVVAFDRKAPTFRHLEYAEYKAGRKKMPAELAMQLPILKDVLAAMNIKMVEMDGFEADDIIGTIAKAAEKEELLPLIITGDKDELQLATQKTKVLITKKGISEFDIFDEEKMIETYGFTPTQFIDYKGLMGDQSDNIPGLPGVGEKTASKLLLEFGSVENLIANTDNIKNVKLREKIEDNAMLAVMSKRLATINTNVPMDIDFSEYLSEEPDYDALIDVYIKLEFNSFLKKLNREDKENSAVMNRQIIEREIIIVDNEEVCSEFLGVLESEKKVIIKVLSDNNHKARVNIYGIGFASANKLYFVKSTDEKFIKEILIFIGTKMIAIEGHNLIKDYYALMNVYGNILPKKSETIFNTAFDTAIAGYLLDSSKSNYEMKTMSFEYFHEEIKEEEKFIAENGQIGMFQDTSKIYSEYCSKWCRLAEELRTVLHEKLKKEDLLKVFYEVELPLIEVLASMEALGFKVDKKELTDTGAKISQQINLLSQKIYEQAGEEFNINSPSQLGIILFEKLELPAGKRTKKGYSTSADILEKLADVHPIINLILEYRTLSKLNSTYIEGLLPLIGESGKIHAHFQQTVTATGRISCTEPNLQNIPIRQELGRKLRKAFIPESEQHCLVGADYSQIELRVLAHMSEDNELIGAFGHGDDIHKITASKVFNIPFDEVTPLQRSAAKAVNFGVIYGMSSFGLSTEIHVSRKEAEKYISDYFERYVDVKKFMDEQVEFCKENGYVRTIMGRKRYIHEITASNYMVRQLGERLAMNSPIQGSAADIIKLAMAMVYRRLNRENLKSRLILQVHDELIIETLKEEQEAVERLLRDSMENAMNLKVKITVDLNSGENWYLLK